MLTHEAVALCRDYLAAPLRPTPVGEQAKLACLTTALVALPGHCRGLVLKELGFAGAPHYILSPVELEKVLGRLRKAALKDREAT